MAIYHTLFTEYLTVTFIVLVEVISPVISLTACAFICRTCLAQAVTTITVTSVDPEIIRPEYKH